MSDPGKYFEECENFYKINNPPPEMVMDRIDADDAADESATDNLEDGLAATLTLESICNDLNTIKNNGEKLSPEVQNIIAVSLEHLKNKASISTKLDKQLSNYTSANNKVTLESLALERSGYNLLGYIKSKYAIFCWIIEKINRDLDKNETVVRQLKAELKRVSREYDEQAPKTFNKNETLEGFWGNEIKKKGSGITEASHVVSELSKYTRKFTTNPKNKLIGQATNAVLNTTDTIREIWFKGNHSEIEALRENVDQVYASVGSLGEKNVNNSPSVSVFETHFGINGLTKAVIRIKHTEEVKLTIVKEYSDLSNKRDSNIFKPLSATEKRELVKDLETLLNNVNIERDMMNLHDSVKKVYGFTFLNDIFRPGTYLLYFFGILSMYGVALMGLYAPSVLVFAMNITTAVSGLRAFFLEELKQRNRIVSDCIHYIRNSSN